MDYFSKNIRFLRHKMGLSQEEMAQKIGLNRGNIVSYEKGIAEPKARNLLKFSEVFNTDLHHLLDTDIETASASKNIVGKKSNSLFNENNKIKSLVEESEEMKKIVEGFYSYHKMRMRNITRPTKELLQISNEYVKLVDAMNTILRINAELLQFAVKK